VSSYGIRAKENSRRDPRVFEVVNDQFGFAFQLTSSFYCFEVLWQIVNGAAPFCATTYPLKDTLKQIRADSLAITFSKNSNKDLAFYRQGDALIMITSEGSDMVAAITARQRKTVMSICERYDLDVWWFREP
jgi:hypothetical protein